MKDIKFVIVGGGRLSDKELRELDDKLTNRYVHLQNIDNQQLNLLYNHAFCLLYPSEYEGFGIPILEAMQAGCPVVTTRASSIPEVCGDAALMVQEICADKFAEEIKKLNDKNIRKEMTDRGFRNAKKYSWDRVYKETVEFYNKILERRTNT